MFAESAFQSGADEDNSGDISEEEFLAAAPAGAFIAADTSSDGVLSPSEVLASSAPLLLALADTDGSSNLSVAEVAACYNAYDVANAEVLTASAVAAAAMFAAALPAQSFGEADDNGDGSLTAGEAANSSNALVRLVADADFF